MVFQRALLHACLVPEAAFTLVIAAGGLLLPASTARADVETVTVRLEEARCLPGLRLQRNAGHLLMRTFAPLRLGACATCQRAVVQGGR